MDNGRRWREDHARTGSSPPPKRKRTSHNGPSSVDNGIQNGSAALRCDQYNIAWICALHFEMAAARAMLDDFHEPLLAHATDTNTYILGSIQRHNIVIACLPTAQHGMNNAAIVATNLRRTFPSIRLGLMVGVRGGAPGMADIRLGDVVVGTRVMQYDLGKTVGEGQFEGTATWRIPHQSLGTAVSILRSKHELEPSRIPHILGEKLERQPDFLRPRLRDRLFSATYNHQVPTGSCDECDPSKLVPRSTRISGDPVIHYGGIASANQVMKSGAVRDNVARRLDVKCFEMETSGLMDTFSCLPIRGISDYSDSHKSDEWQRYAAAVAAAYARELIEALPKTHAQTQAVDLPDSRKLVKLQLIGNVSRSVCLTFKCRSKYIASSSSTIARLT
ncbi:hypothetical protein J3459_010938 [Metarhizium acridum]|nr:hypothetical protein J3459_010938 [Metarhizium acridum]